MPGSSYSSVPCGSFLTLEQRNRATFWKVVRSKGPAWDSMGMRGVRTAGQRHASGSVRLSFGMFAYNRSLKFPLEGLLVEALNDVSLPVKMKQNFPCILI